MLRITKGFSLIELLVVIAVAAVILAVASASYTTAQRQARDARRKEDMRLVQTAFEQYYAEHNLYPTTANNTIDDAFQNAAPTDPKTGSYLFETSDYSYCICAQLEGEGGNATTPLSTSCSWDSAGLYYCVANQQ